MAIKKILCACLGNSDRSPIMRGALELMLNNQGQGPGVKVHSAGVLDSLKKKVGQPAPELSIKIAPTYGLDLFGHRKQHVSSLELDSYDLIIAADKEVQAALMYEHGIRETEIICLELDGAKNAWMSNDPRKVEDMFISIHTALLRYVISYKFKRNAY